MVSPHFCLKTLVVTSNNSQKLKIWIPNPTINDIANRYPNTYVVSSEGCLPCDDYLHFCGEGYRILGRHYAKRYLEAITMV